MVRATAFLWACCVLMVTTNVAQGIGVNWGSQSSHNLPPSIVVQLLKDNGIYKVKLFDADDWTVKAFAGTGIEVVLGIPNTEIQRLSDNYNEAKRWVKENVTRHLYNGGVNIKLLPRLATETTSRPAPPSMLTSTNLNSAVPSDGNFRSDIMDIMVDLVRWLDSNNSPFLVNIYPFLSLYKDKSFPLDFAFLDGKANPIQDKGLTYDNMFDANLDTLIWSLKKAGVPNLKIIVGETGWPTDGDTNANPKLAKRFYDGFLQKIASGKGTPLRPGSMEVYLFGLLDEDMKSIAPGFFERHWGIFRFDGHPKFAIDFTGKITDRMPMAAKGVQYLPSLYCVYNKDVKNMSLAQGNVDYACLRADCSALVDGSSCDKLDEIGKISYAFNMYYQTYDQSVEACIFNGLGTTILADPSTDTCFFPIQIQSDGTRISIVSGVSVAASVLVFLALL
ncbi:O-Glycosyl hydrolases family 17 protein [Actinidia rufa]|uniref:O-Glycosyl hydrolases family 17 protein n=1 Tax=Actinidia rufa TaxID=165716 RepID=A0A7J0EXG3_9ERIC|nr:O-Glycosyl hydrolases family 17 protein [Actinidia rufa]